jgi:ABC-type branched-subunit amino acid transport system substrate-binding protein
MWSLSRVPAMVAALGVCLLMAGCAVGSTTGPRPVKIGALVPVKALHLPHFVAALQAAARDVNAHGGIQGRPVVIDNCDDFQDPNQSQYCARRLVADRVIATAGSMTALSEVEAPILDEAGIPQVGSEALSPEDTYLPTAFPLDGGIFTQTAGELFGAKRRGLHSVFVATYDNPTGKLIVQIVSQLARAAGLAFLGAVYIPIAATSFAPYAQSAMQSHADLVLPNMPPPSLEGFLGASKQAGARYSVGLPYGAVEPRDIAMLGGASGPTEGSLEFAGIPPVSATDVFPALRTFKADMDAELAAGDPAAAPDERTGGPLTAWLSVQVIARVANTLAVPTAANLAHALRTSPTVDTFGLTAPWTPGKTGPEAFPRVTNAAGYFITQRKGVEVLVDPTPFDTFKAVGLTG